MINNFLTKMYVKGTTLLKIRKKGQAMVEYALLIAIIAVVVIGLLIVLRDKIVAKIQEIIDQFK